MTLADIRALLDELPKEWEGHAIANVCPPEDAYAYISLGFQYIQDDEKYMEMLYSSREFISLSPRIVRLLLRALELAGDAIYNLEVEANTLDKRRSHDCRPRSIPNYWISEAEKEEDAKETKI